MLSHQNGKMYVKLIDRNEAEKILVNSGKNRNIRNAKVLQYADTMRKGEWILGPAPIVIGSDGAVYDGRHRLLAVFITDVPCLFWIWEGADPDTRRIIDMGIPRNMADNLRISEGINLKNAHIAAIRAFYEGGSANNRMVWSHGLMLEALKLVKSYLDFIRDHLGIVKGVSCSGLNAAIMRAVAWTEYHDDRIFLEKIIQACQVLKTGICRDKIYDGVGFLREYLRTTPQPSSGWVGRENAYKRTQNVLIKLKRNEIVKRGVPVGLNQDLFPIPIALQIPATKINSRDMVEIEKGVREYERRFVLVEANGEGLEEEA